eukprot:399358-Pyramimonas_sp.AAC.1
MITEHTSTWMAKKARRIPAPICPRSTALMMNSRRGASHELAPRPGPTTMPWHFALSWICLVYTSDAADDTPCVDL